jgi:hypothetical protein
MRHRTQGKLRGLCLVWLTFGALACGDEPAAPAGQAATPFPLLWAEHICDDWKRRDGSCDKPALIADYEDCMRSEGLPELERLRKAGVRSRMRLMAQERMTMLCLERRGWVITATGQDHRIGKPKQGVPPS